MVNSMIQCTICYTENHHLALHCKKCGAFLQNKIETLDLFTTAWGILENPHKTFQNIAVSRHKNYSIILSFLAGIGFVFLIFWLLKTGTMINSLINLIIAGILIGIPFGIITVIIFTLVFVIISRLTGTMVSFKNCFGVTAYALMPVVISAILVLPLEIMTFGIYFFSNNPSPYLLKPTSYILLLILDVIFAIWTLFLLVIGMKKLTDQSYLLSTTILIISIAILTGIYYGGFQFLLPYLK